MLEAPKSSHYKSYSYHHAQLIRDNEELKYLILKIYHIICENLTGRNPRVYRQLLSVANIVALIEPTDWDFPDDYGKLTNIPFLGGTIMAVITISRQYGSGGEKIAHKVAESLGYDYVDKELIATIAQEINTEVSEISRFDEQGQHPIVHFLRKYLIGEYHVIPAWPTYYWSDELEERLVREVKISPSNVSCRKLFESAIKKLGERGNVVIVGRGAEVILAECANVLSVRIIAPLEYRLQKVMQEQSLERDDALKLLKQTDTQRARYIRQNYDVGWDKPELYQLILDTSKISEKFATDIICKAARGLE